MLNNCKISNRNFEHDPQTKKKCQQCDKWTKKLKEKLYKEHIARLENESISSIAKLPMLAVLRKYKYCAYI